MNEPFASTTLATVETDGRTAQRLADGLTEALDPGETAIAAFEAADRSWTVEIYFEHAPDEAAVRRLVADLAGEGAGQALAFAPVAARDWVAASLDGLPPVRAGRFFVHGAHHRAGVPANRIGIEIEAALAFGTGHHGTTRGCLLALDRIARAGAREGWRVLDVGTGTGVLAIAAARALRANVIAGDIDPVSVRLARENARLNRVPSLAIIHARGLADRRFRDACALRPRVRQHPPGPAQGAGEADRRAGRARRLRRAVRPAAEPGQRRARRLSRPRPRARTAHPARRLDDVGAAATVTCAAVLRRQ